MAMGMRHGVYLRIAMENLNLSQQTKIWFEDSCSAIKAAQTSGFAGRTKHVNVKVKCTREFVEGKVFEIAFVPSSAQLADILTKRGSGVQQSDL